MKTLQMLAILFLLTLALLAFWMDGLSALIVDVVDWVVGLLIYLLIRPKSPPPHLPVRKIWFPSETPSKDTRLAA
ncbi:MAG: hypothetical protein M3O35_16970 [Acidobacteriota bacterium]|nr:hypothetical protein [Acidobacteriota bacterium]